MLLVDSIFAALFTPFNHLCPCRQGSFQQFCKLSPLPAPEMCHLSQSPWDLRGEKEASGTMADKGMGQGIAEKIIFFNSHFLKKVYFWTFITILTLS